MLGACEKLVHCVELVAPAVKEKLYVMKIRLCSVMFQFYAFFFLRFKLFMFFRFALFGFF